MAYSVRLVLSVYSEVVRSVVSDKLVYSEAVKSVSWDGLVYSEVVRSVASDKLVYSEAVRSVSWDGLVYSEPERSVISDSEAARCVLGEGLMYCQSGVPGRADVLGACEIRTPGQTGLSGGCESCAGPGWRAAAESCDRGGAVGLSFRRGWCAQSPRAGCGQRL